MFIYCLKETSISYKSNGIYEGCPESFRTVPISSKIFYAIQIKIYEFIDKAFLNNIWENWNQNLHTLGDIGLQGNRCGASRSTLNFVFSNTWRQENNCPQIGHMAFKYGNNLHGITPLFVQYVGKMQWSFDGYQLCKS